MAGDAYQSMRAGSAPARLLAVSAGFRTGSLTLGSRDFQAELAPAPASSSLAVGPIQRHPADRQEDRLCRQRPIKPFLCLLVVIWADSNRSFHSCPPGHSQAAIFIEARSVADIAPGRMTSGSVKPQVASKTQVGTTGPK